MLCLAYLFYDFFEKTIAHTYMVIIRIRKRRN